MVDQDSEDLQPRAVETRNAFRQRALLSGKVASRDGSMIFSCTIRNISETGARLIVPGPLYLPRSIYLVHSRSPLVFEAEVTWMKAPQYGVKFVRSFPRDGLSTDLKFLMRLFA